jgi:hypothetical protein
MLSEQEKQELKEMAASARIREEFSLLEAASRATQARVTPDQYLKFLTTMSRLGSFRPAKGRFVPYNIVRI